MDSSVLLGTQNVCDSTMDFDVSDVDMDEIDENADSQGSVDYNDSLDDVSDDIVGNDSFEYNKSMMKRSYFSKKAVSFEVDSIPDETLPRETNDTTLSDYSDYSENFKLNGGNFLTSTVVDETDFPPTIERANVSNALSAILSVELKLSSFVNEILKDLNKSKEILRQMLNGGGNSLQEKEETISKKDGTNLKSSVLKSNVVNHSQPAPTEENEERFTNGSEELSVQFEKTEDFPSKSQPTVATVELIPCDNESDAIEKVNETFSAKSVPVSDPLNINRPEILSIEYIPCTQNVTVDAVPVPHVPVAAIAESVVAPVESQPENFIKLPMGSIEDHIRNEDLLEEDDFVAALKTHLAPLIHENETIYMNRTILMLFTEPFFLDGVCWKKQTGRINMKHSNLLICWMESYGKQFEPIVDSKVFQDHFRRLKSTLRAAIKAELKRQLNGNTKSKKGMNSRVKF